MFGFNMSNTLEKISRKQYYQISDMISDALLIIDYDTLLIKNVNRSALTIFDCDESKLIDHSIIEFFIRDDEKSFRNNPLSGDSIPIIQESKVLTCDKLIDVEWSTSLLELDGESVIQASLRDVTDRKIKDAVALLQNNLLKRVTSNIDLSDILNFTCLGFEKIYPEMICSVVLYDKRKKTLIKGAGPSLPDFYNKGINGFPVGPNNCSCGTAIYFKKKVVVEDIENDPLWDQAKDLAKRAGLKSCWSIPIFATNQEVLGTFAVYHKYIKAPKGVELENISDFSYNIGLIIEKYYDNISIERSKKKADDLNGFLIKQNKQLEEFTRIASHNLRAPIANIQSLVDLKDKEEFDDDAFIWGALKKVSHNLIDTINDLTEVVKTSWELENKKQHLSISEVCKHVLENVGNLIEDSHAEVVTDFSAFDDIEYPKVYFESILQNFVTNAYKYRSPNRGLKIGIRTEVRNDEKYLVVEDNGIGIDLVKYGRQIFGLKKVFHGNEDARGLGLYITKTQVESLGGEVFVESKPDRGAKFGVRF